jgi:folate-dependent phosphoribosylglycinamide formyltransferase PurN
MKILILTSYTTTNVYLVNHLTSNKNVIAKVIEKSPLPSSTWKKMEVRTKMVQKYGFIKSINKLLFNKYRSFFINQRDDDIIKSILFPGEITVEYSRDIPSIEVHNINETECEKFIKIHSPDIIAVCGTTVIRPHIFKLSKNGTINIHCGITPEYRSADSIFWALYNGEPDKVGVTIHFVDEGIDTGDIIYQETVKVEGNDTIASLYAKCIVLGADLLLNTIEDIENNNVKIITKKEKTGKSYYHMDLGIWQYLVFQLKFSKIKDSL